MDIDIDRTVILLGPNDTYQNRGCEAIIRETVKILRKYLMTRHCLAPNEDEYAQSVSHKLIEVYDKAGTILNNLKDVIPKNHERAYSKGKIVSKGCI